VRRDPVGVGEQSERRKGVDIHVQSCTCFIFAANSELETSHES
jgi:hypothetical protein